MEFFDFHTRLSRDEQTSVCNRPIIKCRRSSGTNQRMHLRLFAQCACGPIDSPRPLIQNTGQFTVFVQRAGFSSTSFVSSQRGFAISQRVFAICRMAYESSPGFGACSGRDFLIYESDFRYSGNGFLNNRSNFPNNEKEFPYYRRDFRYYVRHFRCYGNDFHGYGNQFRCYGNHFRCFPRGFLCYKNEFRNNGSGFLNNKNRFLNKKNGWEGWVCGFYLYNLR